MLRDAPIVCKAIVYELQLLAVKHQGYFRLSLPTQHRDHSRLIPKAIAVVTFRRKLAQTLKLDPVLTLSMLEVFRAGHLAWITKQRCNPVSGVRGGFPSQAGAFRQHSTHLCTLGCHCLLPAAGKCLEPPFSQNPAGKRNGQFSLAGQMDV